MKLKDLYLSLLNEGKNYHILEIDIRYLLSFYQGYQNNNDFYLKLDDQINNLNAIKKGFNLLKKDYPLAYIISKTIFLGNEFYVDKNVLIPRMETEELVMLAIKYIHLYFKDKKINILDVGVGSGAISISLKKRINANIYATDISSKAIKVAKINAKKHNANIKFYLSDTYPNIKKKYDVIISNPPYIKYFKDVNKSVIKYEPHEALFLKKENNVYEKIFKNIAKYKKSKTLLLFEISDNLVNMLNSLVKKYLSKYNLSYVYSKDINKHTRFLIILIN